MIKNFYVIVVTVLSAFTVTAQSDTIQANLPIGVEKSIFNVQTGILGLWVSNEARLGKKLALRTEVGLNAEFFGGDFYKDASIFLAPGFRIEPRIYYNIDTRYKKGRNVSNNSSNFAAIAFSYYPDWFIIGGNGIVDVPNQITIVPKWAIRRSISNSNFTYEAGIGIGYRRYFYTNGGGFSENTADLHVRIGYTFK